MDPLAYSSSPPSGLPSRLSRKLSSTTTQPSPRVLVGMGSFPVDPSSVLIKRTSTADFVGGLATPKDSSPMQGAVARFGVGKENIPPLSAVASSSPSGLAANSSPLARPLFRVPAPRLTAAKTPILRFTPAEPTTQQDDERAELRVLLPCAHPLLFGRSHSSNTISKRSHCLPTSLLIPPVHPASKEMQTVSSEGKDAVLFPLPRSAAHSSRAHLLLTFVPSSPSATVGDTIRMVVLGQNGVRLMGMRLHQGDTVWVDRFGGVVDRDGKERRARSEREHAEGFVVGFWGVEVVVVWPSLGEEEEYEEEARVVEAANKRQTFNERLSSSKLSRDISTSYAPPSPPPSSSPVPTFTAKAAATTAISPKKRLLLSLSSSSGENLKKGFDISNMSKPAAPVFISHKRSLSVPSFGKSRSSLLLQQLKGKLPTGALADAPRVKLLTPTATSNVKVIAQKRIASGEEKEKKMVVPKLVAVEPVPSVKVDVVAAKPSKTLPKAPMTNKRTITPSSSFSTLKSQPELKKPKVSVPEPSPMTPKPPRVNASDLPPSSPQSMVSSSDEDESAGKEEINDDYGPPSPTFSQMEEFEDLHGHPIHLALSASSSLPPEPIAPLPESIDLPSLLSSTLVFSHLTQMTVPLLLSTLLSAQPSLVSLGDQRSWSAWVDECVSGPGTIFGRVKREGKDAAGKDLEDCFFYDAGKDTDSARRRNLGGLGRPVRETQRSGKQYYFKRPSTPGKKRK